MAYEWLRTNEATIALQISRKKMTRRIKDGYFILGDHFVQIGLHKTATRIWNIECCRELRRVGMGLLLSFDKKKALPASRVTKQRFRIHHALFKSTGSTAGDTSAISEVIVVPPTVELESQTFELDDIEEEEALCHLEALGFG